MNTAKILVVADDRQLTGLLRGMLMRRDGFLVREENRSFAICTALEFSPDLVILDVDTLGHDGSDLVADLRQLPPFATTPIVCLSAFLAASGASRKGGETFLCKPIDPILLVATARGLLSARDVRPAPRTRFLPPREGARAAGGASSRLAIRRSRRRHHQNQ